MAYDVQQSPEREKALCPYAVGEQRLHCCALVLLSVEARTLIIEEIRVYNNVGRSEL